MTRGLLGRVPRPGAVPIDYELAGGPSLTRLEALVIKALPRPLAALAEDVRGAHSSLDDAARRPAACCAPGWRASPQVSWATQMRLASLPALSHVVGRLGVDAEWVLFGHVHRLGPLPGDLETRWRGPQGRPNLLNTGSWVYEPLLVHNAIRAAPVLARRGRNHGERPGAPRHRAARRRPRRRDALSLYPLTPRAEESNRGGMHPGPRRPTVAVPSNLGSRLTATTSASREINSATRRPFTSLKSEVDAGFFAPLRIRLRKKSESPSVPAGGGSSMRARTSRVAIAR